MLKAGSYSFYSRANENTEVPIVGYQREDESEQKCLRVIDTIVFATSAVCAGWYKRILESVIIMK